MRVDYRPKGSSGFLCVLTNEVGFEVTVERGDGETHTAVLPDGLPAQAAIAAYADLVRAHLDIPDDRLVLCPISFGFADADHPANGFRTERAPLGELLDWRA